MAPKPYRISPGHILTPWAEEVDPSLPLPEYPRPQMVREAWHNLNGLWDYAITPTGAPQPTTFQGHILVPYPLESALSGVKRPLRPDETLWYRRIFQVDPTWADGHTLLHFGAVDWSCRVFLNGVPVGAHTGGYDPFTFDITRDLREGDNELVLAVTDPTDTQPIQRGKQVLKPGFIWYTAVSGIWQTVWLEHVPQVYLQKLRITPDLDQSCVLLEWQVNHTNPDLMINVRILDEGRAVAEGAAPAGAPLIVPLIQPKPWSPESPHLYDLEVTLCQKDTILDRVQSYFGLRKYSLARGRDGLLRFYLNNEPCFLYGPLDQGYWPDGLFTPPSDQAVAWEIDFLKKAGFNMLRKHVKVEPLRFYTHCDRAGIIVWQDMVSGGLSPKPVWFYFAGLMTRLHDDHIYWRLGRGKHSNREHFRLEYQRMLDALYNVVSIAIWGPFNEGWGQFDAAEIAEWTRAQDPSRLVDHASGWFDQGAGDFKSEHVYFKPLPAPKPDPDRAWVLSEFGGYSLNLPEHAWNPQKDFGYKKFLDQAGLTEGYCQLLEDQLFSWVRAGLSAAVYTQTTDVETEVNGFLSYDRKVCKMDLEKIKKIHQKLFDISKEDQGD